ncbi:MAG: ATP-binding protein, partial [Pararhizobium sp.]
QVVLNLLLNALEAMKQTPATERNVVLTSGLGPDGTIQVHVRDNGTGIQLGMNEKLFEAFYTTKEQGMGVGLSVSRAIIESLGGILWASPNVDAGATFSFTLRQHREAGGQLH